MTLADNSTQYLDFKPFAYLPYKIANPSGEISLHYMIEILGLPHERVFSLEFYTTAFTIVDPTLTNRTTYRLLPARMAGF